MKRTPTAPPGVERTSNGGETIVTNTYLAGRIPYASDLLVQAGSHPHLEVSS